MRDGVAAFYDPYATALSRRRWEAGRGSGKRRLTKGVLSIVVAGGLLVGLVAADASVYYALPVKVTVTEVRWFVGNYSVGNQSGFSIESGQKFTQDLVCEIFCPAFTGVAIGSPFALVNDTFAYPWFEYANLTIAAPNSAYTGPLTIVLEVGGDPAAVLR